MTYELAKKLKDSGFPMVMTDHEDCTFQQAEMINGVFYHIPTLEELIEACGKIIFVKPHFNFLLIRHEGSWSVSTNWEGNSDGLKFSSGSTPEEAVANLWLELNKNGSTHKTL